MRNTSTLAFAALASLLSASAGAQSLFIPQVGDNSIGAVSGGVRATLSGAASSIGAARIEGTQPVVLRQSGGSGNRMGVELRGSPVGALGVTVTQTGSGHQADILSQDPGTDRALSVTQAGSGHTAAVATRGLALRSPDGTAEAVVNQQGTGNLATVVGTSDGSPGASMAFEIAQTGRGHIVTTQADAVRGRLLVSVAQSSGDSNTATIASSSAGGEITSGQYGNNNQASLALRSGTGGRVQAAQYGDMNKVWADVVGNNQSASVVQSGYYNVTSIGVTGNDNIARVESFGDFNAIGSNCSGVTGAAPACDGQLRQDGSRNLMHARIGGIETAYTADALAAMTTIGSSATSSRNYIDAAQSGVGHQAVAAIAGFDNGLTLRQGGSSGNTAVVGVIGDRNRVSLSQDGSGGAGHSATLLVRGNDNSLSLTQRASATPLTTGIGITGNGVAVTATQTSGGLNVNLNNQQGAAYNPSLPLLRP